MNSRILDMVGVGVLLAAFSPILLRDHSAEIHQTHCSLNNDRRKVLGGKPSSEATLPRRLDRAVRLNADQQRRLAAMERLFSEDPLDKVAAAQVVAGFNDEDAFMAVAQCVARTEATGETHDLELATQLGEILSGLEGYHLIGIATELAYSPSHVVAEAATNVAIASSGVEVHDAFGTEVNVSEATELDVFVDGLLQSDE